ncbi:PF04536 family protein [Leptospira weilii serovar Ranarum str. ICFT]|uniref:PF04536 family protein n=1 Tax=Leptospira weilii serovar Ranarum str. ICFT TaxID=1218598 RepID=N1WKB5_9LEPT|nr:TPM domain-containing protein [Leptospira weilii]EMY77797.1 PF04536 family protein [Leptospira weilii serovar Ranarum str. ICFT]
MIKQNTTEPSNFRRIWIHTLESVFSFFSFTTDKSKSYRFKKYFSRKDLQKIEAAVAESETRHKGEIKIILESGLPIFRVIQGINAKQRAMELFSEKRVWDTEENTGILIYVQLTDRKIELLADRGIYKKIGQSTLDEICERMQTGFRSGCYSESILTSIETFTQLLQKHFPPEKQNPNELSNRPEVI